MDIHPGGRGKRAGRGGQKWDLRGISRCRAHPSFGGTDATSRWNEKEQQGSL